MKLYVNVVAKLCLRWTADIILATHFSPRDWPGPILAQRCILLDVRAQGQKARVPREGDARQLAGYLLLQLEPKHRWVLYSFSRRRTLAILSEKVMGILNVTNKTQSTAKRPARDNSKRGRR